MSRPKRKRRIELPPSVRNFKPCGIPRRHLKSVSLSIDEYEAVRLTDYLGLEHSESADRMEISRPTFSRLIESARKKLSESIVEGKELIVEGGNIEFKSTLQKCNDCGIERIIAAENNLSNCNNCGSDNIEDSVSSFLTEEILK